MSEVAYQKVDDLQRNEMKITALLAWIATMIHSQCVRPTSISFQEDTSAPSEPSINYTMAWVSD